MSHSVRAVKTVEQLIKERKEKKRLKTDRFIAKLERQRKINGTRAFENSHPVHSGRKYTISIALPSSILDICQTVDLKCYVASMVARCAVMFGVDEIVVFNDTNKPIPMTPSGEYAFMGKMSHCALTLGGILQYMECPPHLRKCLFPPKPYLFHLASEMNPLHIPHHNLEIDFYREGVVSSTKSKPGRGSYVYVGLEQEVEVDRLLDEGLRVTVKMNPNHDNKRKPCGTVVSPNTPQFESALYWGYSVRLVNCFSEVFNGSPFGKEYDLIVGTSENGTSLDDVKLKPFRNALIVFGGMDGLEAIIEADENLTANNTKELFPFYVNTCPSQGSRTIRTEEAVFISLAALHQKFLLCDSRD